MQKRKPIVFILLTVVMLAALGMYTKVRSPAPKPIPEPSQQESVAPSVPSLKAFDSTKYKVEPQITVWISEKGVTVGMPLETYLEGVIAQEMNPNWPPQALAAQAIVSRTLTISAIESGAIRNIHNADVSTAKEELQAYAPQKVNATIREAVRNTRGLILLYNGSLVNAIYSSCNGQISATKEESFPNEITEQTPYFQAVADTCFDSAPVQEQSWRVKIPGREVANAIGYTGNPSDITIVEKGPSGRILFIGAGDKKKYGSEFRKAVGYDRLKSTLITAMEYDGQNFTFTGKGWGNGVGLCQWGAYSYARQGWTTEQIISHYYVGTEVKKIWE